MVYLMLHTNRTFTDEYFPFFEVVYTIEVFFILLFYALAPVAFYLLWNARPLHINLRLSLCNLIVQGLFGMTARLCFLYNHYVDKGPLSERPSVIVASILRCTMFEAFCGVFYFISLERFVATFAWSWYEKASLPTIIVFVVIETSAQLWSSIWAIGLVFEFIDTKQLILGLAGSTIVGGSIGLFVGAVNHRESMKLKAGVHINGYSVARTYQIRENVLSMKALFKIAVRIMLLNTPVFALAICHLFLGGENGHTTRMISRAFFDLVISLYPAMIITYIPFADEIFERSLKRMPCGDRLFNAFALLHWASRKKRPEKMVVNESDRYFTMLAASLHGPPKR